MKVKRIIKHRSIEKYKRCKKFKNISLDTIREVESRYLNIK